MTPHSTPTRTPWGKQPRFTRVEEPTLLCNHWYGRCAISRSVFVSVRGFFLCCCFADALNHKYAVDLFFIAADNAIC